MRSTSSTRSSSGSLAALAAPDVVEHGIEFGGDYEALYFQQTGRVRSPTRLPAALSKSIDRQALFAQIYAPTLTAAGIEASCSSAARSCPGLCGECFETHLRPERRRGSC